MRRTRSSGPDLISLTVHELRTPITIVGGYLRMLLRDPSGPLTEMQRRMVEEAEKACGKLSALVAELSDLGNLAAGTAAFTQHDMAFGPLLQEAADALSPDDERPILVRDPGPPAVVKGDAVRLKRAFSAIMGAVRRELLAGSSLVIESKISRAKAGRTAMVGVGAELAVARLLRTPVAKLIPLDIWRGGSGLSVVIADQVLTAHGGRLLGTESGKPTEPCAAIVLPVH
jgi:signal transduction histidine kinase